MGKYDFTEAELVDICRETNQDLSETVTFILRVILKQMNEAYEEGYRDGLKAREGKNEL